jgi:mono/diheme cytochrome c family protein
MYGVKTLKFAAWLLIAPLSFAGDPNKGKDVFIPCSYCHDVETGARKRGPSLKNLFLREQLVNGQALTPDSLRALIRDGFNGMPSYGVLISRTDFDDLVAFLEQYTDFGKGTFDAQCGACHNAGSNGLKDLFRREKLSNGKPVNDANVSALIEEGGKGMPGYKDSLDETARKSLLAYLKSL